MDGIVHTYKARLMAKRFTQLYRVDYEETFSPVADIRAIRILIAITAFYDYEIWQMDVKTAFLNCYLDEDIYMVQPKGFVDPKHPRKNWSFLDEPCVYQKASGSNVTFLILYVDDIIIMGNHIPSLQSVKSYHGKCFAMKDLREATFILGIKIYRDRMDNSKRGTIPQAKKEDLNDKTQVALTPKEVELSSLNFELITIAMLDLRRLIEIEIRSQERIVDILIGKGDSRLEKLKHFYWLGIVPTINEPIKMFCDDSTALLIANEPGVQKSARHYHRRYLLKVHTYENLADPFTKALPKRKLTQHARSMGLRKVNAGSSHLKNFLSQKQFSILHQVSVVLEKVGEVAYKLELPEELSRVHNTFHVSNLKKCHADEPLAVPLDELHLDDKLHFVEEPVEIVGHEVKRLKRSRIPLVKVRWNSKRGPEFTWEREDQFQKKYPHLFTKTVPSSSAAS
ncbi:retrotransposon protein, putative, ty1-copia subclass [Tanacetum coccineum]|uniref:Retrotransposon protein, putative, ty1-copia subclass n=1 Tax=Tanacetum coccineum TaxID=301880 RepID=A0ABQ4Z766_9ASTR